MKLSQSTFFYGFLSVFVALFVLTVDIGRAFAYVKQQVVVIPPTTQKLAIKDIWRSYNGRRESPIVRLKTMLKLDSSEWVASGYLEKDLVSYKGRQYVSGSACLKAGRGSPRVQLISRDNSGRDFSIGVFEVNVDKSQSAVCDGGAHVYFSIRVESSWQAFSGHSLYAFLVYSDGEKFQHFLLRNSGDVVLNLKDLNRRPASVNVALPLKRELSVPSQFSEKSDKTAKKQKKSRMLAAQSLDEETIATGNGQKLSLKGLSRVEKRAIKRFLKDDPNIQFLDISEK